MPPTITAAWEEPGQLEQSVQAAVEGNAFRLSYQPIVEVETRAIIGYEALLRWSDPVRGDVAPAVFIPIAETTGLIVPLGRSALEWACIEAARWSNNRTVAVNVSPAQFYKDDLIGVVHDVLRRSGLAPERLDLEVTEGMLLEDTGRILETMSALQHLGVALTLDDFGLGNAGLRYLKQFPFQRLKIDGYFIRSLEKDHKSQAIVAAIVMLAERLGMRVVAEGIETEAELDQLRQLRCRYVQGNLTGPPMTPEQAQLV